MTKPNYPPPDTKTPKPLYSCAEPDCAHGGTHRAEDLSWVEPMEGWYCDACIDSLDDYQDVGIDSIGPTLAEFLEGRG